MELTEDEIVEKHAQLFVHCPRVILLPYDFECFCVACGNDVIKEKHQFRKISRKNIIFNIRLKDAEHKFFLQLHRHI